MKITNTIMPQLVNETKMEVSIKKQQEIELVLEGYIKPKNGQFVWEINKSTGEINKAEYKKDTVGFTDFTQIRHETLIIKSDCVYIPALNSENAKKKFHKNNNQSFYYSKQPILSLNDIPK